MTKWLIVASATVLAFAAIVTVSCGEDIDLGGGGDSGASDAGGDGALIDDASIDGGSTQADGKSDDCEPCTNGAQCQATSACVALDAGNPYCLAMCEAGPGCDPNELCTTSTTTETQVAAICTPAGGACPTAVGPNSPDGAPLERCGTLVAPSQDAGCRECKYDCQRNGCYGGYWCNTATKDCSRPPKTCS